MKRHAVEGTTLRLRKQIEESGSVVFKLTQKTRSGGAQQRFINTMYINADEYNVLAKLPAKVLTKTRHSVPPFGIGLVLAEAEFESAGKAEGLSLPPFILREVSDDDRFTGGWLAEYQSIPPLY